MNYKDILYNLVARYERAVSNNGGKRIVKGIDDIVDTYIMTIEKERATTEHKQQYSAFLEDISGAVVDKEKDKKMGWQQVLAGCLLGVAGGGYVGATVLESSFLGILSGVVVGVGTATAAAHVVSSLSYARKVGGVVGDYIQALNRVDVKQLEEHIDEKQLLEKSVLALESDDKGITARTARSIRKYFSSQPEEKKLLPPKKKR